MPAGRDAYLDGIVDSGDSGQIPAKPVITYNGDANYPLDGLRFTASDFRGLESPHRAQPQPRAFRDDLRQWRTSSPPEA